MKWLCNSPGIQKNDRVLCLKEPHCGMAAYYKIKTRERMKSNVITLNSLTDKDIVISGLSNNSLQADFILLLFKAKK